MDTVFTTVIFDLGGVLLLHPKQITPYILSNVFQIPYEQAVNEYKKVEIPWRSGRLKGYKILDQLRQEIAQNKTQEEIMQAYKTEYIRVAVIDEIMINLIKQLKLKYRIVLSTNTQDIHHEINKGRGLFDYFDRIYPSFEIGLVKPTIEYFQYMLRDINESPSACFFVDDKEENIAMAKNIGLYGHLFSTKEHLKKDLQEKGLL